MVYITMRTLVVVCLFFWAYIAPSPVSATVSLPEEGPCQVFGDVKVVSGREAAFPPSRLAEESSRVTWRPNQDKKPAPGTYWLRFSLTNPGSAHVFCVLIPPKLAPLVELYPWGGDEPLARSGWLLPLNQRAMSRPLPAIPVSVPPGVTTWLLKVTVLEGAFATPRNLRVEARTQASFYATELRANHLHGIYGGIMLAVVLYNLLLFASLRERLFLLYVLYATSFGLIWLVRAGMALAFLWPSWPRWDASAGFYFIGLAVVAANAFTSEFLGLRRHLPGGYHTLRVLSLASLLCLLGGAWQMYPYVETPLALVAMLTCGVSIVLALRRWSMGNANAGVYLAATGFLLVGTVIYILAFFKVLPTNAVTANAPQVGSAVEMVLLALVLGNRIRELEEERKEAERTYSQKLEAEVSQRTTSLRLALEESRQAREMAEATHRELQRLNMQLTQLSLTDALTGLANRRRLEQVMDEEWRRAYRHESSLALVLVDVDHFKNYNDSLGHQAGDELLKAFGELLGGFCRRPGDLPARYGGEEFAIVLPGLGPEEARIFAEGVRSAVVACKWPHPNSPIAPWVTVSCGVTSGKPARGLSVKTLIRSADEGLYKAKRAGRNQVHLRFIGSGEFRVVDG